MRRRRTKENVKGGNADLQCLQRGMWSGCILAVLAKQERKEQTAEEGSKNNNRR